MFLRAQFAALGFDGSGSPHERNRSRRVFYQLTQSRRSLEAFSEANLNLAGPVLRVIPDFIQLRVNNPHHRCLACSDPGLLENIFSEARACDPAQGQQVD